MSQWNSVGHINSSLIFFLERDVRGFLVESDAEPFQFSFDYPFVREWFIDIEHNKYQIASPGHGNDLTTSTLGRQKGSCRS